MTHGPLDLNDFQNYKFKNKQENNKTSDTLYYTCGIVHRSAYYHRTYMHIYKILFPSLSVSLSFRVISPCYVSSASTVADDMAVCCLLTLCPLNEKWRGKITKRCKHSFTFQTKVIFISFWSGQYSQYIWQRGWTIFLPVSAVVPPCSYIY